MKEKLKFRTQTLDMVLNFLECEQIEVHEECLSRFRIYGRALDLFQPRMKLFDMEERVLEKCKFGGILKKCIFLPVVYFVANNGFLFNKKIVNIKAFLTQIEESFNSHDIGTLDSMLCSC